MANAVLTKSKPDIFASITEKIVSAIETGAGTCSMPWHSSIVPPAFPQNATTGKAYRGVNVLALWIEAQLQRYVSGHWASYKQWQSLGVQVRKGERGALIVFYKPVEVPEDEGLNFEDTAYRPRFVARASHVFNAEQVEGWEPPQPEQRSPVEVNDAVSAFIAAIGVKVRLGGQAARYRRNLDIVELPAPEAFIGTSTSSPTESYHAVLCHETIHWSGAPHRLDREFGRRFGDRAYAFEELVAELGAAFLCSAFGIVNEPRPDHAAYIRSWLEVLGQDTRAIFTASSKAQEAVEYLRELAASAHR